jgi:broad specificity phosphatase PhoE
MTAQILLLRHAETTHPHVFNGAESDVPLSARGLRQARAIAPILAESSPAAVISSGMIRAIQTATPIAEACNVSLRIEPELHERAVGELRGKTHAEAEAVWNETLSHWRAGAIEFAPPGAESFLDVQRRSVPVLRRLAEEHDGQTIIIVAHGHVCRVLLLSLLPEMSSAKWEELGAIRNLGIIELNATREAWQMVRFNEVPAVVESASDAD